MGDFRPVWKCAAAFFVFITARLPTRYRAKMLSCQIVYPNYLYPVFTIRIWMMDIISPGLYTCLEPDIITPLLSCMNCLPTGYGLGRYDTRGISCTWFGLVLYIEGEYMHMFGLFCFVLS